MGSVALLSFMTHQSAKRIPSPTVAFIDIPKGQPQGGLLGAAPSGAGGDITTVINHRRAVGGLSSVDLIFLSLPRR